MAYEDDLRNQLSQIQNMGSTATNYAQQINAAQTLQTQQAAAAKQAQLQQAAQAKWQQQQASAVAKQAAAQQAQISTLQKQLANSTQPAQTTPTSVGSISGKSSSVKQIQGKGNTFENFVTAISGQESGGNYGVVNHSSGALGKYQIMPGNVASWTKAALGKSLTPAQFLASPKAQDATARHFLQGYYNTYGPAGAAVAWYAGAGTAARYVKNPGAYNGSQGSYPSINSYAMSILSKMGLG